MITWHRNGVPTNRPPSDFWLFVIGWHGLLWLPWFWFAHLISTMSSSESRSIRKAPSLLEIRSNLGTYTTYCRYRQFLALPSSRLHPVWLVSPRERGAGGTRLRLAASQKRPCWPLEPGSCTTWEERSARSSRASAIHRPLTTVLRMQPRFGRACGVHHVAQWWVIGDDWNARYCVVGRRLHLHAFSRALTYQDVGRLPYRVVLS